MIRYVAPDVTTPDAMELKTLVEASATGLIVLDDDDRIVFGNPAAGRLLGRPDDELLGETLAAECHPGSVTMVASDGPGNVELSTSTVPWQGASARLVSIYPVLDDGDVARELNRLARQNEALNRLGAMVLQGATPAELYREAAIIVHDTLEADFSTVLEYNPLQGTAQLVAGTGWPDGQIGDVMTVDGASQAGMALVTGKCVSVADWRTENRFPVFSPLRDNGVLSGIDIVVRGEDGTTKRPWGIMGAHSTRPNAFNEQDINMLRSVANVLAHALQRAHARAEKEDSDMLLRAASRTAQLGGWEVDPEADRVIWSASVCAIYGLPQKQTVMTTAEAGRWTLPESRERAKAAVLACLEGGTPFDLELQVVTKHGEPRWVRVIGDPVFDEQDNIVSVRGAVQDITGRKRTEDENNFLAMYDPLTQLPNRRQLDDLLHQAIAESRRTGRGGAVMLLDVDNFKALNDTLGHHVGDRLLQEVARRLQAGLRETDAVARFGGDEFIVIANNLGSNCAEISARAMELGRTLLDMLKRPYQLGRFERFSTKSIGITLFGMGAEKSLSELLKQVDMAMYQAKADGRDQLCLFDPDMQAEVNDRAAMETEIRSGLKQGQFCLWYQAQVDAAGHITGAETLIRWMHPERGMVSPGRFIPLAEETRLILPLGRFVLESACAQLARWAQSPHTRHLTLSVNVSAEQFHHPDFVANVLSVIDTSGADPCRLILELTERSVVKNVDDTARKMAALGDRGITFSLDDFGTGYSSLYYLQHLPLTELKIDQSFVRDIHKNHGSLAIARTIMALAESLELRTIAEGVESTDELDALAELGCRAYQGFYFARPQPIAEFEQRL